MKKYEDDIIASVAQAVSDVVEGKVKEELKYPHDMFDPKTGEKEVAKDEAEHKVLSKKGYTHDKPEVDEADEPKAKGEKDFVAKHKVKKSGEKEDGSVVKEASCDDDEDLDEAVDKKLVKKAVETALKMGGNMTGAVKKIEKMMKGLSKDKEVAAALQLANEEVSESVLDDAHAMNTLLEDKAKYKAFFNKALKKFGVKSPGELEGDKKKEFFDYVDAGYEADNEED